MVTSAYEHAFHSQVIAGSILTQFWQWYRIQLEVNPVLTKCCTSSLIQFTGDLLAQSYDRYRLTRLYQSKKGTTTSTSSCGKIPDYNPRRGLSLAADGMFVSGPLLHFAFELMEKILPSQEGASDTKSWISMATILHVIVNDLVVDTIYLFLSFIFVALMEGLWRDVPTLIRRDFPSTVQASWGTSAIFMPVEYVLFSRLPLSLRVLSINMIDVIWGGIISFVSHRNRHSNHDDDEEEEEKTPLEGQTLKHSLKHETLKMD